MGIRSSKGGSTETSTKVNKTVQESAMVKPGNTLPTQKQTKSKPNTEKSPSIAKPRVTKTKPKPKRARKQASNQKPRQATKLATTVQVPRAPIQQALAQPAQRIIAPVMNSQSFVHKPATGPIPTQIIMQPAPPHFYENVTFVPNANFVPHPNPNFGVNTYANGAQALISLYHSQVAGQKRKVPEEQSSPKRIKLGPANTPPITSKEVTKAGRVRKQHNWSHDDIMELIYIWGEVQLEPSDGSFKWQCIHERYKQKHEWASLSCIRSYFKAKVKSVYNCKKVYDHVITYKQFPKPTDTWIYITRKSRGGKSI